MSIDNISSCIEACEQCVKECAQCRNACLEEERIEDLVRCIKLDGDCIALCDLTIRMLSAGSQFSEKICNLCAELCEACASECENHPEMRYCKKCAEVCRACAEECRAMVTEHIM
jgi:hypothetical protein